MVRKVVLGGGVPLVEPQEKQRYPSGYIPRGFTSRPRREAKYRFLGFITTNKQEKQSSRQHGGDTIATSLSLYEST